MAREAILRRSRSAERGEGRIGCFLWAAFALLLAYAAYIIIPVKVAASRLEDFISEETAFAHMKGNAQILQEILAQAKELEIPLTKEQVLITRTKELITIVAEYQVTLSFLGLYEYVWTFHPEVTRPVSLS